MKILDRVLEVVSIIEKRVENGLRWFEHLERIVINFMEKKVD